MKHVLEFGTRRGQYTDNIVLPNRATAMNVAANLARVLSGNTDAGRGFVHYASSRAEPRTVWQSNTHFIAVSALDGIPRGPASAVLWK